MRYKQKRVLLDQLLNYGIIYETYDKFEQSIFSDVYNRAFERIGKIVEENREYRKEKKCQKNSREYYWEGANIISFVGRRGTGKTSAMLSMGEAIQDGSKEMLIKRDYPALDNIVFHKIECINAAMMEKTEDIMSLIIANMVAEILKISKNQSLEINTYDNRSILQMAEVIYEDLLVLQKSKDERHAGYSPLEKLKNIAGSQNIRNAFSRFVEKYLQVMNEVYHKNNRWDQESYLIIMIDDVDVSRQKNEYSMDTRTNAYEIMQSIQQYLSVPQVIVFASYNHVNLYNQCREHFLAPYINHICSDSSLETDVEELTSQYLDKTFPISMRLYMPSWRKRDFESEGPILIDFEKNKKDTLKKLQRLGVNRLPVKEFVMELMAEKAGIYFDIGGQKRHFLEPDNLRSLCNYADILITMQDYRRNLDREFDIYKYKYNIRRLKEDIYYRYAKEKIRDENEGQLLKNWLDTSIDRRSEDIVRKVSVDTQPLGKLAARERDRNLKSERDGKTEVASLKKWFDNSDVAYSYAELIHSIFHMTRDKKKYSKELVSVILYSYTTHLSEIYQLNRYYKQSIDKEAYIRYIREEAKEELEEESDLRSLDEEYKMLKSVIGTAVCGRWTEYFFPEVRTRNTADAPLGVISTQSRIIGYIANTTNYFPTKRKYNKINLRSGTETIDNQLDTLLFGEMLRTKFLESGDASIVCDITDQNEMVTVGLYISDEYSHSEIDFLGCFRYTFCYGEFLMKFERSVLGVIEKEMSDIEKEKVIHKEFQERKELLEVVKRQCEEYFIRTRNKYYEWDKTYGNMMLPLYSLDITYNLIKRMFQECKVKNTRAIELGGINDSDIFWKEYMDMLRRFLRYLEQIDKEYYITDNEPGFAKVFKNCPFYTMAEGFEKEEDSKKEITNYIIEIVEDMEIGERMLKPGE